MEGHWELLVLALLLVEPETSGLLNSNAGPCDKTRKVYMEPWGVVSAGPPGSNYTQDSHCEWLIKGKK